MPFEEDQTTKATMATAKGMSRAHPWPEIPGENSRFTYLDIVGT